MSVLEGMVAIVTGASTGIASRRSSFVTGQAIAVDGGYVTR